MVNKKEELLLFLKVTMIWWEKKHTDLEEFLKGTISGEKLMKNVCDKSDEKYETGDNNILSGKQAALECNAIPLESFISKLHRKVDIHFVVCK